MINGTKCKQELFLQITNTQQLKSILCLTNFLLLPNSIFGLLDHAKYDDEEDVSARISSCSSVNNSF